MNLLESHKQKKLSKAISLAEQAGYVKAETFKNETNELTKRVTAIENILKNHEKEESLIEERIERKFANFADRIKKQLAILEKSVNETCEMAQLKRELLVVKSFENRIRKLEKPVLINGRRLTNDFKFTINDTEFYNQLSREVEELKKKYSSFARTTTRSMNEAKNAAREIKTEMDKFSSTYKSMLKATKRAGKITPTKKQ